MTTTMWWWWWCYFIESTRGHSVLHYNLTYLHRSEAAWELFLPKYNQFHRCWNLDPPPQQCELCTYRNLSGRQPGHVHFILTVRQQEHTKPCTRTISYYRALVRLGQILMNYFAPCLKSGQIVSVHASERSSLIRWLFDCMETMSKLQSVEFLQHDWKIG